MTGTIDTTDTAARLRRAVTHLHRRLRQNSLGGTSPAQASALSTVERLSRPSLGELAAAEQVQPPTITRVVRDLVALGMLDRLGDPDDRRCVRVTLTARGRRELATIRPRKNESLERTLAALSPAERSRAGRLVDLLETIVERV